MSWAAPDHVWVIVVVGPTGPKKWYYYGSEAKFRQGMKLHGEYVRRYTRDCYISWFQYKREVEPVG